MKIFGVGRNYREHAKELGNSTPAEPIIFTKPETALLRNNAPFYYPDFSDDIHYEVELVIKIAKEGKNIHAKFADKYIESVAVGIDFTARDLQQKLKEGGLPWDIAKGFNGSAPVSEFISIDQIPDINKLSFSLRKNGIQVQKGAPTDMVFTFGELIAYISRFFTFKKGDLIYTGTPSGVGPIQVGDILEAYLGDNKMLITEIK